MEVKAMRKRLGRLFNVQAGRARYKTIRKRILDGAKIDGIHLCQLMAAMLIASIGLNVDSTEAVIGAMLICPLMGSVLAIAYAIASVDRTIFREALGGLAVQTLICLFTSTLYFVLSPLSTGTSELLTNSSATVWDVLIAFVGGFAGSLGNSRKQEPTTLIAGVAVATALMPPLCSTGYGLAMRDMGLALSAFYEFLINVVFIAFGAEIVLVWLGTPLERDLDGDGVVTPAESVEAEQRSHTIRRNLIVGSLVFAIPCLFFSHQMVRNSLEDTGSVFEVRDDYQTEFTTYELRAVCPSLEDYRVGNENSFDVESGTLKQRVVATVVTSKQLDETKRKEIRELIRLNITELDDVTFLVAGETT